MARLVVAVAVLCALLTATLGARTGDPLAAETARESWLREFRKPPTVTTNGKTKSFLKHFAHHDHSTGEQTRLSYNSTFEKDFFVSIDDPEFEVTSVTCTNDTLTLKSASRHGYRNLLHAVRDSRSGLMHGKEKWGCPISNKSTEPGQIYRTFFVDCASIKDEAKLANTPYVVYNRSLAEKYHQDWQAHNDSRRREEVIVPSDLTMVVCTAPASPFAFFGNTTFSFFTNDTHNDPLQLRSRSRRYGTWTGSTSAQLINVNYDASTGSADTPSIDLMSSSNAQVTCDDCYMYAGAGIGFEFETDEFDYRPSMLLYFKLYVSGEFASSVNLNAEMLLDSWSDVASESGATRGIVLQDVSEGVQSIRSYKSQDQSSYVKNSLKIFPTLSYSFAGLFTLTFDAYAPVFVGLDLKKVPGKSLKQGTAFVGAFFRKEATYGIAWKDPNPQSCGIFSCETLSCTLPGCTELTSSDCDSDGWCPIQEVTEEHGGHGLDISGFGDGLIAQLTLTPLIQFNFYDGWLVGSLQLDAKAVATMTPNSPSCADRRRRELANHSSYSAYPAYQAHLDSYLDQLRFKFLDRETLHETVANVSASESVTRSDVSYERTASRQAVGRDLEKSFQAELGQMSRRSLQPLDSETLITVEVDAALYVWGSIDVNGGSYFGSIYEATSPVFEVFSSLSDLGLDAPYSILPDDFCVAGLVETLPLVSSMPVTGDTKATLKLGNRGGVIIPDGALDVRRQLPASRKITVTSVLRFPASEIFGTPSMEIAMEPLGVRFESEITTTHVVMCEGQGSFSTTRSWCLSNVKVYDNSHGSQESVNCDSWPDSISVNSMETKRYVVYIPSCLNPADCDGCTSCGQNQGSSWQITDGSGADDYKPHSNCVWTFTTSSSARNATITFSAFDLENNVNNDYVKIFSCSYGDASICHRKKLILTMYGTGQGNVGVAIESTTNVMRVEFSSDGASEHGGFSATFGELTSVSPMPSPSPSPTPSPTPAVGGGLSCTGCTGCDTYTGASWAISDGSGSSNYPNNALCEWIFITSDSARNAKITFSEFELKNNPIYDYVKVYSCTDSTCSSSSMTLIVTMYEDGQGNVGVAIEGTTNVMRVEFKSDGSEQFAGFSAAFGEMSACTGCTGCGTYTGASWAISDGSGSSNLFSNALCEWIFITSDSARNAKITFSEFELLDFSSWDYVKIYSCPNSTCSSMTLIETMSGAGYVGVAIEGTTNVMRVEFKSSSFTSQFYDGFSATFGEMSVCTGCTGCGTYTGASWSISDGSGSSSYPSDALCEWIFITSDSARNAKITFSEFELENDPSWDYVKIYSCPNSTCSSMTLIDTMYGDGQSNVGVAIEGTTNVMRVEFKSDSSSEYDGFSATFGEMSACTGCTGCGTYTGASWAISDGSGSSDYSSDALCEWIFIASNPSQRAQITFSSFNTEIFRDYVRICDCSTDDCSSKTQIRELSGSLSGSTLVQGNTRAIMVIFSTDGFTAEGINATGFEATFTSFDGTPSPTPYWTPPPTLIDNGDLWCEGNCTVCGTITGGPWPISGSSDYSNAPALCEWIFMVSDPFMVSNPSQLAQITFSSLNMESDWDYVSVYDCFTDVCWEGDRTQIREFSGSLSGSTLVQGTTPWMMVIFQTDNSEVATGFEATFTAFDETPYPTPSPTPSPTPPPSVGGVNPWQQPAVIARFSGIPACTEQRTWAEIIPAGVHQGLTQGGVGIWNTNEWKSWVCWSVHPCLGNFGKSGSDDMCYVFNEATREFWPWGFGAELGIQTCPSG